MLQNLFCSGDVETQHEMSTFCNEFKLFQSPLKAGVGISWTGSLAWRDSFCRVAVSRYQICFGFKLDLRQTI